MRTTVLLFFSVWLSVALAGAQTRIKGTVADAASGTPLPFATVVWEGTYAYTVTNGDGYFELNLPASARGILKISLLGYLSYRDSIAAFSGKERFLLSPDPHTLRSVEVSSTRAGSNDPFTSSRLSAQDLEKTNTGKDLPILLDQTPGIVVNSDAGNGVGYTAMRIRGSDITRINVTIDGIPVNDAESQSVFWVNTPDLASSASDIQIQRGAGTSTNGAGAFGASVNLSTTSFEEKPYAELAGSYGSFNTYKATLKAGTGLIAKRFTIDARASKIHSDGYIDRATTDLQSFFVSAAWHGNKTNIRFNAFTGKERTYQAWNGVPQYLADSLPRYNESGTEKPGTPYANETDNYRQDYYRLFITHSFSPYLTLHLAGFLTRGKGYYEQYKAGEDYSAYLLPPMVQGADTSYSTDLVRQLWLDNYFYGATYALQYTKKRWDVRVGGAYSAYDGRHYGKVIWASEGLTDPEHTYYRMPAFKNDFNIYGKLNFNFAKKWYVFADLQYRYVNYKVRGFRSNPGVFADLNWNFFNPKAGISWRATSRDRLFLSFAVANKEPNRDDLEAGASSLPRPETLYDTELGYEHAGKRFSLGATAYFMYYRNQLIQTGKINDVGAYTRVNVPESYRAGIELQGKVRFLKRVTFSANVAYSINKIPEFTEYLDDYDNGGQQETVHKNTDIAFSPSVVAGASLEVDAFKGFNVALVGKFVSRQYLDNTQNKARSLDPFVVSDLRMSYLVPVKARMLNKLLLHFTINNLFNTRYTPNGYTYGYFAGGQRTDVNYVFPMAGIHFTGGLTIRIQ